MNSASKNIVILGALSDIGAELARTAAARDGYRLLLVSRRTHEGAPPFPASARLKYLQGIDLIDEGALRRLRDAARSFFTEPFSVVHSVGDFWQHKALIDTPFSEMRSMIESHYLTLCGAASALIPVLSEKGGGRLVAFSCNSVSYNYPDMAPFTAAKAAVESFIRILAHEHAEFGIAATALALPTIRTPKVIVLKPDGDHPNYLSPEELALMILDDVLCLPQTVNGNVVKVYKYSPTFYHTGYYERNPRV